MSSGDDVYQALRLAQIALDAEMRRVGAMVRHPSTLGTGRERLVAESIASNIPQRVDTRQGQIRAPGVPPSSEWDVILCDPQIVGTLAGVAGAVPIESVLAVPTRTAFGPPMIATHPAVRSTTAPALDRRAVRPGPAHFRFQAKR